MDPNKNIAPRMSNNEALRRLLAKFMDENGNPAPGSPGGPTIGLSLGPSVRHAATGPLPVAAYQLMPADDTRVGGQMRNLDMVNIIYYGSSPNLTDATGGTLKPGETVGINVRGPIYIYCTAGAPIAEFMPAYNQ